MRWRFDRFVLDETAGTLLDGDRPVHLQPKAYELLVLLVRHPGVLFSREDLLARLWPEVHVTDESLSQAVARVRRALEGTGALETVPRRGYRFAAPVAPCDDEPRPAAPPASPIDAALATGHVVVLHGPPGSGKTFLARAVAARWPGECIEVALAGAAAAGDVTAAVAGALGLGSAGGEALAARISVAMANRSGALVVLDALDSASDEALVAVGRWMAAGGRWIVTTRVRPAFEGQRLVPVERLGEDEAVALLTERLPAGTSPPPERLRPLVRALDGNPLALVLAAARLRVMQPEELAARIDRDARVLGEPGGRSLGAAIAQSWERLGLEERDALARLSVTRGPLPLAATEALLAPAFAPDLLQRLDDHAWLAIEAGPGGTRTAVRRHLREWVLAHADRAVLREATDALGAWLAAEGTPRAEVAGSSADAEAWGWLREHADAVHDALADPGLDARHRWPLVRIAALLVKMWGTSEQSEALARRTLAEGRAVPPMLRLKAWEWLAQADRHIRGRTGEEEAQHSLREAREIGDLALVAGAEAGVAQTLVAAGDRAGATEVARRAVALAHDARSSEALGHALAVLGRAAWTEEEGAHALEALLALPLPARSWTRRSALVNLATRLHDAGRFDEAEALYRDWLATAEVDPPWYRSVALGNLGNLLADTLRFDEAAASLDAAIAAAARGGLDRMVASFRLVRGDCAIDMGDPATAEAIARSVADDERVSPAYRAEAGVLGALAAWRDGRVAAALVRAQHALGRTHDVPRTAHCFCAGAAVAGAAGDAATAAAWIAVGRSGLVQHPVRHARALLVLAEAFEAAARGVRSEVRAAVARLHAAGPPEAHWPKGAPPLALHLRRMQWALDRLPR